MRLFNQSKNQLGWSMGGQWFECEPWGQVEVPDDLVSAARSRGLPLDVAPVAPEVRATVRVADERAVSDAAPLLALKAAAEKAEAGERAAKDELGRVSVELSAARNELREANERLEHVGDKLKRALADKQAAEDLVAETAAQATAAEARAIKADALLAEKSADKVARPKRAEAAG